MQKRNLGKSMKVSSVGLGCMGITHASGTPLTKAEGMKVLESALEIGYNFFDTAVWHCARPRQKNINFIKFL